MNLASFSAADRQEIMARGEAPPARAVFVVRAARCVAVLVALASVGCGESGPKTYPVSGTVTLSSGDPLVGGTVSMTSLDNSLSATGRTDARGRFAMGTFGSGDGVPRGTYRAVILPPVGADADAPQPAMFNPRYSRYETSGLEFTVEGPIDDLKIHLEE